MNAFRTILRFARRHAPEILSALSAAGTIGTGVLSARMMTKKNEDGKIPIAEIVPPAACAAATIGCIVGSNAISRKRQAGLAAAYMLLGRGMAELKGQTAVEVIEVDQKRPESVSDGKKPTPPRARPERKSCRWCAPTATASRTCSSPTARAAS